MSFRPTFSVATILVVITAFATSFAISASNRNEIIFPSSVAALLGPIVAWIVLRFCNAISERHHVQVYLAIVCFAFGLLASFAWLNGNMFGVPACFVAVVVWTPQLVWIAFFELCEWERRNFK